MTYPRKPGLRLLTWSAYTVPVLMVGVVAVVVVPAPVPKKFSVQVPPCVLVPNGSDEVLAIAIPVSKPGSALTHGYSSVVWQREAPTTAVEVAGGTNRGTRPEAVGVE